MMRMGCCGNGPGQFRDHRHPVEEPEAVQFATAIEESDTVLLSAASLLEASIIIESRLGPDGTRDLDLFLYRAEIEVVAVDRAQVDIARTAWRKYGKDRHPASLNYGDCFSYALARATGEDLLFKGNDFSGTDLGSTAQTI